MGSTLKTALGTLAIIAAIGSMVLFVLHRPAGAGISPQAVTNKTPLRYISAGYMSALDYDRLAGIHVRITHAGKISEADARWCASLLDTVSSGVAAKSQTSLHQAVLMCLTGIRTLTALEQQQLLQAVSPLTMSSNRHVKRTADRLSKEVAGAAVQQEN